MDEIHFTCTICHTALQAPAKLAGQIVYCPSCKTEVLIPEATIAERRSVSPEVVERESLAETMEVIRVDVSKEVSPQTPHFAPVPQQQQNNGLAIASLALSISSFALFMWILTAIPAIICGHIALARCKENPQLAGRQLAIAGLIIGYINVGIVVGGGLLALIFGVALLGIVF